MWCGAVELAAGRSAECWGEFNMVCTGIMQVMGDRKWFELRQLRLKGPVMTWGHMVMIGEVG